MAGEGFLIVSKQLLVSALWQLEEAELLWDGPRDRLAENLWFELGVRCDIVEGHDPPRQG